MGLPVSLENDVHELKQKVAYLDGWRESETHRYERVNLAADMSGRFDHVNGRIDNLATEVNGRIDNLATEVNGRIDRVLWFMVATLGAVLVNIMTTIVLR